MNSNEAMKPGFQHGTRSGFEQGCKTNPMCANDGITAQTCKQAAARYYGDFKYKKLVDSGVSEHDAFQQMFAEDSAPVVAPKPTPRAKLPVEPIPTEAAEDAVPAAQPKKRKPAAHGTISGYATGCRDDCPKGENGLTCREAMRLYSANQRAKKAAELAALRGEVAVNANADASIQNAEEPALAPVGQTYETSTVVETNLVLEKGMPDPHLAKLMHDLDEARQTNLQLRLELDVRTSERDDARSALWTKPAEEADRFGTPVSEQEGTETILDHAVSSVTLQVMSLGMGHEITMLGVVHPVDIALTIGESGLQHVTIVRSAAA